MQFTQCLLDLMGFPKDNSAKVTCVAGKLQIPILCAEVKEKKTFVRDIIMATLRVDKEHF